MLFAEMTPLTPLGPKQAEEFLEIENFRVPGVIAVKISPGGIAWDSIRWDRLKMG